MYIVKSARMSEHRSHLVDLVLEGNRPEDWRASASCAGMDPTLFELPDNHRADDLDRMKQTIEAVCGGCPVKQECLDDADRDDLRHTIRGGLLPGSGMAKGRPRLKESELKAPRRYKLRTAKQYDAIIDEAIAQRFMLNVHCRNGHELTRENVWVRNHSRGGRQGYCAVCHKGRHARKDRATIAS